MSEGPSMHLYETSEFVGGEVEYNVRPNEPFVETDRFGPIFVVNQRESQMPEVLPGDVLANTIRHNYYLVKKPEVFYHANIGLRYRPESHLAIDEITGMPGSGKHSIQQETERLLIAAMGETHVLTESEIESHTAATDRKQAVRLYSLEEIEGPLDPAMIVLTRLGQHSAYHLIMQQEDSWAVTTKGPLGSFQMMALAKGQEELTHLIKERGLVDAVHDIDTLTQLAGHIDEPTYEAGMNVLGKTVYESQIHGGLPQPMITTPIPITHICGQSIKACRQNMEQNSQGRLFERPYGNDQWPDDILVSMRFVHALMIKTAPHMFREINTTRYDDFSQEAKLEAQKLIRDVSEITQQHDPQILNPNI